MSSYDGWNQDQLSASIDAMAALLGKEMDKDYSLIKTKTVR